MTPEQQRIAIAEACGWQDIKRYERNYWTGTRPRQFMEDDAQVSMELPDYPSDLNAIREVVLGLPTSDISGKDQISVRRHLGYIRNDPQHWQTWLASAAEMTEAFLRALRLWEE